MPCSFGTFEQRTRAARKGRNPKTGAELNIPAKKVCSSVFGATRMHALPPPPPESALS